MLFRADRHPMGPQRACAGPWPDRGPPNWRWGRLLNQQEKPAVDLKSQQPQPPAPSGHPPLQAPAGELQSGDPAGRLGSRSASFFKTLLKVLGNPALPLALF